MTASAAGSEAWYLDNLFAHVGRSSVRDAYVEPVLARLLKKAKKETVPYNTAFKMLTRASNEIAADWQRSHGSMFGRLPAAAQKRQAANLARSFMEIYFVRLGQQRGQDHGVAHGVGGGKFVAGRKI